MTLAVGWTLNAKSIWEYPSEKLGVVYRRKWPYLCQFTCYDLVYVYSINFNDFDCAIYM